MTMNDFLVVGTGTLVLFGLFIIAQVAYRYRAEIVSIVSGQWRTSIERARVQKTRREQLYGYVDFTSTDREPASNQRFCSGFVAPVPGQQNQEFQNQLANFEMVKAFLSEHNLSDEQVVIILALIRRASGDELLSANKIRDIAGGADGMIKPIVAAHRKPRPKPRVAARIERPAKGWPA